MKTQILVKKTLWVATLLACTASVQSVMAAYKEPNSYKSPKKTITLGGNGKYSTKGWNDTGAFNKAINDVHAAGGGRVIVPGGSYIANGIGLKDNVHLLINKNAKIRLPNSGGTLFAGGTLRNTSVRGTGGYFKAELRGAERAGTKVFHGWNLENVMLQNINIINNTPTHSQAIALDWASKKNVVAGRKRYPNNITIQNVQQTTRSHYGYGVMQVQASRNTHFTNMRGKGGVPVRLETGWVAMQRDGRTTGGVHNIAMKNCVATEAQSVTKINPHTMQNGDVYVDKCTATATVNVVSFEAGSNHANTPGIPNVKGSFGKVTIKNTKGVYRPTGAPYKSGSFTNLPVNFVKSHASHKKFYKVPSGSKASRYHNFYMGPSANVVSNTGKARKGVTITGVFRSVASKYGSVPEFRKIMTKQSVIQGWMIRGIPVKNTPAGW